MTKRSTKGSKYKNGHISAITYGTRQGVVLMDIYLFGASYEIVLNKFGTTNEAKTRK